MNPTAPLCAALLLAGCTASQEPNPCDSEPEISVTRETEIHFHWAPGCGIAELAVGDAVGPGELPPTRWWIRTRDGRNTIESGVRYGRAPGGTETVEAPQPLEPGVTYTVSLIFYTPFSDGTSEIRSSTARFTR